MVQAWQGPDSNSFSFLGLVLLLGYVSWVGFVAGWRFIVCIYIYKKRTASMDVLGTVQMGLSGAHPYP